jgi:hypothetical protein
MYSSCLSPYSSSVLGLISEIELVVNQICCSVKFSGELNLDQAKRRWLQRSRRRRLRDVQSDQAMTAFITPKKSKKRIAIAK